MNQPVEEFEHAGFTVKIWQDEDAMRSDEWDNGAVLVTTSNRYFDMRAEWRNGVLTQTDKGHNVEHFVDEDGKVEADIAERYDVFPLSAYIHGGVSLSVGSKHPMNCPWDSGKIGVVFVDRRECPDTTAAAEGLVENWNAYLSGDVWGVVVEDEHGEVLESCGGFYGVKYAMEEGRSMAEGCRKAEDKAQESINATFAL